MDLRFLEWLDAQQGRQYELHERYLNPAFVKMIRTIGFDKNYIRGEGAWLFDAEGNRYLDLLTGWGVFALGRNHPRVRSILEQVLSREMPNLVRMDCSLLAGLVAERLTGSARTYSAENLTRVFFCNSGTESIEAAIKFARCATRKPRLIFLRSRISRPHGWIALPERFGFLPRTVRQPAAGYHQGSLQRSVRARKGAARQRYSGIRGGTGPGEDLRGVGGRIPGGSGAALP